MLKRQEEAQQKERAGCCALKASSKLTECLTGDHSSRYAKYMHTR